MLKDLETRMQAATDALTREFAGVRTGRANASLLDGVRVEAYGNLTPINQLATVSVPDPRTIVIQPWDASQMKEIEKAHRQVRPRAHPRNDGKVIRLTMPTLTEERRKQLAKTVGQVRGGRAGGDPQRRAATPTTSSRPSPRTRRCPQDEERRGHDQIQKTTDRFTAKIDELAKKKEQEVMTV